MLENSIKLAVPLKIIDHLETEVKKFTNYIQNAAWSSTPVI